MKAVRLLARSCPPDLRTCLSAALLALLSCCGTPERRTERLLREAVTANPRPVEARLSSSQRYAPWGGSPATPRPLTELPPEGEDRPVLRGSRPVAGRDPEELHRLGLLELYHGGTARAVAALEATAERQPSALALSDLAAAYLALAEDDRPWLVIDAIVAATRATGLAPQEPQAAFNLALALERLSLVEESGRAWERYLTIEDDGTWRREATDRLARLRQPTTADLWAGEEQNLLAAAEAGDRPALAGLTRRFARQAKELLEAELLPAWAEAVGTPAAETRLALAKRVAEALAETGELLYLDSIATIERRKDSVSALAEGHLAYARAQATRDNCSQAEPEFERARKALSAGSSPMALAARFGQLVCLYRGHPGEAAEPFGSLAGQLDARRYPTLLARTEGMRGLCLMNLGRHSQALAHYERAVQILAGLGDSDATRWYGTLDEAYRFLGDRTGAWRHRLPALRSAVRAANRQLRHSVLAGLARDLTSVGRREAAQVVLDEMLANARAWSQPGAEAETLLRRIDLHLADGQTELAAAAIAVCEKVAERYQQPAAREQVETELILASAELRLATSPLEALEPIRVALPRIEESGRGLLFPRALLGLARAHLASGELAAAEEAFERGLQVYERRRAGTVSEEHRISFFATTQASFDAMIRFQALDRGDERAAFAYTERVRTRELRERVEQRRGPGASLTLDEQLERLPANVAVLAYGVLPEELLVWRLRQGSLEMHVLPVSRPEVAETVTALRSSLGDAHSLDVGKATASRAFDLLLRPALDGLPAETELVFLADRELHQVPFAALFDKQRGRFVVEDHAVEVAPSLELYLGSVERGPSLPAKPRRVLAVGDPAFDHERFPSLPSLPEAREEAQAVAKLYSSSRVLVGEQATREQILDEMPGSDIVHLAAHVVVDPRNPLGSWVATADLGREPLRASDLDAGTVAGVELVFLSACDTAPGFADGDREGAAGLARALLASGVPSVVATLWPVKDEAARRLATVFHSRLLEGRPPSEALRLTQLNLLSEPALNDPFAWVPFQLFRGL